MVFKSLRVYLFTFFSAGLLLACGESDAPQEKSVVAANVYLPSQVVYQEAIYKNWPYTEAPSANESTEAATTEAATAPVVAANAQTHTINAEARLFRPNTLYINPGDTVGWINMTSHDTVSVEGLIPEGAMHWSGKLGQNLKIKLDVEGIYAYVCQPHIGFGMVGLIIVGKPTNLEEVIQYAKDNLQGPFRRLIGKLIKVKIP